MLILVILFLLLRARCRYCQAPISTQYPLVELLMAIIFAMSYKFWPGGVIGVGEFILFSSWLLASVGLIALAIYDWRWMLLPNKILYPTLAIAVAGRAGYLFVFDINFWRGSLLWFLSVIVAAGLFLLIFIVSRGRWIGYGDVRLGLITGTLLATPARAFLMIFLASLIGTAYAMPQLIFGKQKLATKVPFGPFLILASFIVMLFGTSIIDWYIHSLANL